MPIRRSSATSARRPSTLYSEKAENRITAVAPQAISSAIDQSMIRPGSLLAISITAAMPDGPATSGIAIGTMKGSPSGVSPKMPSGTGKIMRRPIRNSTMPPAIAIDSWRRCITSST